MDSARITALGHRMEGRLAGLRPGLRLHFDMIRRRRGGLAFGAVIIAAITGLALGVTPEDILAAGKDFIHRLLEQGEEFVPVQLGQAGPALRTSPYSRSISSAMLSSRPIF
jgi:hypothetical protein